MYDGMINLVLFVIFIAMFVLIGLVKNRFTKGTVKKSAYYYSFTLLSLSLYFLNQILTLFFGFYDMSTFFLIMGGISVLFSLKKMLLFK